MKSELRDGRGGGCESTGSSSSGTPSGRRGIRLPAGEILPWIQEQHDQGIWVSLVRESDIGPEPDLLCDFGIYDDPAAGIQELDDRSRTLRFILHFDGPNIGHAKERWARLLLYADSYADLVDRSDAER